MKSLGKLDRTFLGFVFCFVLVGCSKTDFAPPENSTPNVIFFAAASTINAVEEIGSIFEKNTGIHIVTNFASAAVLSQQIDSGAEASLFLSANQKWVDSLEKDHWVSERVNLLGNQLVLIVPKDSKLVIHKPDDLLSSEIQYLAIADPDSIPAGIYAKQALTRLHLWNSLQQKSVRGTDVRQTLLFVEKQEAEAGIVYSTDANISQAVRIVYTFADELTDPIIYPLALIQGQGNNSPAYRFYQFLQSDPAKTIFQKWGFRILSPTQSISSIRFYSPTSLQSGWSYSS